MKRVLQTVLLFASFGCGHADVSEEAPPQTEPATDEAAPTAADEPEVSAPPTGPTDAEMRARAEAFVRAQGYADTPATAGPDEIVHEGIEGTVEMRRNTLDPVPASGGADGNGGWSFTFRYIDPQYAGRGRLLVMSPDEPPRFVHQDIVFPQ